MQEEYGSKPDDIKALIGPGICREHYSVDPELALEFNRKFPESVALNSAKLDLREINKQILKATWFTKFFDMNICTSLIMKTFLVSEKRMALQEGLQH
jgi:copper oxidase (laccase) domain-containing protein